MESFNKRPNLRTCTEHRDFVGPFLVVTCELVSRDVDMPDRRGLSKFLATLPFSIVHRPARTPPAHAPKKSDPRDDNSLFCLVHRFPTDRLRSARVHQYRKQTPEFVTIPTKQRPV
jgi:hypothetical protein